MATVLGRADVLFGVQDNAFHRGLARVRQSTDRIADRLDRVGTLAQRMLLLSGGALAGFIKLASDAEEISSKFEAVFKEETKAARVFADELATSVGRSSISIQEFLASLQDMFIPLGFTRSKARDLSQQLVKLGIDVASFQNKSEPDTLRDFQSALVGNHETVRKYGIIINDTRLQQEVANKIGAAAARTATDQQKVLARLSLIMKGTTDAQGDALRTAGSLANRFKAVTAAAKDAGIAVGEVFIPEMKELSQTLTTAIPKITKWVEANKANIKVTSVLALQVLAVAAVLPKVIRLVGVLIPLLFTMSGLIVGIGGALVGLALSGILREIRDIRLETAKLNMEMDHSIASMQALSRAAAKRRGAKTPREELAALKEEAEAIREVIQVSEQKRLNRDIEAAELRAFATRIREQITGLQRFRPSSKTRLARAQAQVEEAAQLDKEVANITTLIAKEKELLQVRLDRIAKLESELGKAATKQKQRDKDVAAAQPPEATPARRRPRFVGLEQAFREIQRIAFEDNQRLAVEQMIAKNTDASSRSLKAIASSTKEIAQVVSADSVGTFGA